MHCLSRMDSWRNGPAFLLLTLSFIPGTIQDKCTVQESYTVMRTESYTKTMSVRTQYPCFPKIICSRTKIHSYTAYRQVPGTRYRSVETCCPGWVGENCDIACPAGRFGADCLSVCQCENEAVCQPSDGSCICKPGHRGRFCSERCKPGSHGHYCLETCDSCPLDQCHHQLGCLTTTTVTTRTTTTTPATTTTTTTPATTTTTTPATTITTKPTPSSTTKSTKKTTTPRPTSHLVTKLIVPHASPKLNSALYEQKESNATKPRTLLAGVPPDAPEVGSRLGGDSDSFRSPKISGSSQKSGDTDSIATKVAVPVCLLVLIALLMLVVVFTRRRMKRTPATGDEYVVAYTAPPTQLPTFAVDNGCYGVLNTEIGDCKTFEDNHLYDVPIPVAGATAGYSDESLVRDKQMPMEDHSQPCVSYRSQMNDLNAAALAKHQDEADQINIFKPSSPHKSSNHKLVTHIGVDDTDQSDEENN